MRELGGQTDGEGREELEVFGFGSKMMPGSSVVTFLGAGLRGRGRCEGADNSTPAGDSKRGGEGWVV
jgi:hypothetical protein